MLLVARFRDYLGWTFDQNAFFLIKKYEKLA
jgi:hypothetical protein